MAGSVAPPPPVLLDAIDMATIGASYTVEEKLGEGSYGVVFRACLRSTGAPVAIKKLRLDGFAEGVPATAIREITLLQELKHVNIVHLLNVLMGKRRLYLIFELAAEDLRTTIVRLAKQNRTMPVEVVKRYTEQMLSALWYCHNSRVIHRDLKPGNILVSADGKSVKLADFGLARAFELPLCTYTHEVVTLWYRAPEILLGEKHYTPAVDVWSVGCIVVEMLTGKTLFRGDCEVNQLHKIFSVVGTPTEATWPGVTQLRDFSKGFPAWRPQLLGPPMIPDLDAQGCDFVNAALRCNPKERATAAELLSHPWLTGAPPPPPPPQQAPAPVDADFL